ncbi:MAG: tyrosine-type recombinase/integrase [Rhizobiales bacterium]|nr:tyrosine-type recombinase/integrase [Hyphomicrobiales bacterium]
MVKPYHDAKGAFTARKRIPRLAQDEYAALYGQRHEVKFFEPPTTPRHEQLQKFHDWLAETEGRIAAIIAAQKGEGTSLTPRQARALAGQWYLWFVERHPVTDERHWAGLRDRVHEKLTDYVSDEAEAQDPDALYRENPKVREAIMPLLADIGETAQFLALKRIALNNDARGLFLDNVYDDLAVALQRLMRTARGDYSPDKYPERFPAFEGSDSGITPWQLFEMWVEQRAPAAGTVESWTYVFEAMAKHFSERSAASISPDEADEWIKSLINSRRSARTVKKTWLNASNTVFRWAVEHKKVNRNPFADVKVTVPRQRKHRETKAFKKDEQQTILRAASAVSDSGKRVDDAAKRWVAWLCAYTGARPGEMTQLRGSDVVKQDDVNALKITPEAGTVKGGATRVVPIHQHLIAQGFLKFVARRGQGPLFYTPRKRPAVAKGAKGRKPPYAQVRQRLAGWVRAIGVTDKHVSPNHGWRHTFKQIADRVGISERMSDYITGHAHKSEGSRYGEPTLSDMAKALKKFLSIGVQKLHAE